MASIEELSKAVNRLNIALDKEKDEFIRDSVIQRFEFCVELACKAGKKVLGLGSSSPKTVIRDLAKEGVIGDPKLWFKFIEARNLSVHTYQERLADEVYETAKNALPHFIEFVRKLEEL